MLMLSQAATAAITALCRRRGDEPIARLRAVSSGPASRVTVELGAEPTTRDVAASRDGVTVLVDRELAPATANKVLHAEAGDSPTESHFLLREQPVVGLDSQPDQPDQPD